jgi:predicted AlkP superfamily phosphohydrolase/phosphomutase
MKPLIVIGVDGGSWELLTPLIEKGDLPNIQKLMETGVRAVLESSIPALTFPSWKCYSTGKNPGKLGVYSLASVDIEKQRIYPNYSSSFKSNEFWDLLGQQGVKVGIINMPSTYPPKKVNGFMISGPFTARLKNYYYPEEIKPLLDSHNYKILPDYYITRKTKELYEATQLIKTRFKIAKTLFRNYELDFLHLTIFFTDTIQHFRWGCKEVETVWKTIDGEIGELVEDLGKINLIIFSDHGFTKLKGRLYLNTWLEKKGYLRTIKNFDFGDLLSIVSNLGIKINSILEFLRKTGIINIFLNIMPEKTVRKMVRMNPEWGRKLEGMENKIDWETSKVIPLAPLIYLNRISETETQQLIKHLREIKTPEGEKIVKTIHRREEIYSGEFIKNAPELILIPNHGYELSDIQKNIEFSPEGEDWKGTHTSKGIFIASGNSFLVKTEEISLNILDIAPTILHLMDSPIPSNMDGKVLTNMLTEEYRKKPSQQEYEEEFAHQELSDEEKEIIAERLRKLGYIG